MMIDIASIKGPNKNPGRENREIKSNGPEDHNSAEREKRSHGHPYFL
jgi:hypothetical protein